MKVDVLIAGAGISGLLLASELAKRFEVVVIERRKELPTNKYWLTDLASAAKVPELSHCIDSHFDTLDYVAYDDTRARIFGPYVHWSTEMLLGFLRSTSETAGARFLFDHPFLSCSWHRDYVLVKAGPSTITARLLIDCMGFASPIVSSKRTVSFLGFFALSGQRVQLRKPLPPIALHNALLQASPTYFELFPTNDGRANAAMIAPTRALTKRANLSRDLSDTLRLSPYNDAVVQTSLASERLFGTVPVGVARRHRLDRVFFFGEAGQVNPATSATALSRMLHTYKSVASTLSSRLETNRLRSFDLQPRELRFMSPLHRLFQESLFRRLLRFSSDDFRRLVAELDAYEDSVVNGLIFADLDFRQALPRLARGIFRSNGLLWGVLLRAVARIPMLYSPWNPRR